MSSPPRGLEGHTQSTSGIGARARRAARRSLPGSPHARALTAAVVAGATARFATLDLQSFSHDEAVTVLHVVKPGLPATLEAVAERERSGPLYYVLAWVWALVSPSGEIGFRALPALFGTLTIPVAYLAASELATRRAGAIAAVLVALNPFLLWYSQEARSYALFVLLAALSLLFTARALRRPGRNAVELALWSAASAGALASHYFALFVVVPEALWLLHALRVRAAVLAVGATGIAGAALLPLALHQGAQRSGLFADTAFLERLLEAAAKFSAGNELSLFPKLSGIHVTAATVSALVAALWLAGALLVAGGRGRWQPPTGLLAAGIGLLALGLPAALAPAGLDLVNARNLIGAVVPLLVAAACGLGAPARGRAGVAVAGLLAGAFLANLVLTTVDPALQRRDFRAVAERLGSPSENRLIVASRLGVPQLALYADAARERGRGMSTLPGGEPVLQASEIVVVAPEGGRRGAARTGAPLPGAPRFELGERRSVPGYELLSYRAKRPGSVPLSTLSESRLAGRGTVVLSG